MYVSIIVDIIDLPAIHIQQRQTCIDEEKWQMDIDQWFSKDILKLCVTIY